jgi:hypothetical protein
MTALSDLYKERDDLMDQYLNDQTDELAQAVDKVDVQIARVGDPTVEFESYVRNMTRKELGGLIAQYIAEANHESWDAWSRTELFGIRMFLLDVMTFHKASDESFETSDYYTGSHYLTKDMGQK